MTTEEFDQALRTAARHANFGPLDGFGGVGSTAVFNALPAPLQQLFREWNFPTAILAGRDTGPNVRHFAEACGKDVAGDLAALSVPSVPPCAPQ